MIFIELLFWLIASLFALSYISYYSLMYYESKKHLNRNKKPPFFPDVSIVIATYNEEKAIRSKLENTLELDYPREKLELVLIDSGSKDKTKEVITNFLSEKELELTSIKKVVIFEDERKGKATALNKAFASSSGEIIIITDADVILESNSVSIVVDHFSDNNVGAVTGQGLVKLQDAFSTEVEGNYRTVFDFLRRGESNMDSTTIFNGPLSAYRRNLIPLLKTNTVTDDIELAFCIREKGYRTIYEDKSLFYENYPPNFFDHFKQKKRRAQGLVQSVLRHRNMIFNSSYGKFGMIIFPMNFFMSVISPLILLLLLALFLVTILLGPSLFLIGGLVLLILTEIGLRLVSKLRNKKLPIPSKFLVVFLQAQLSLLSGLITLVNGADYSWDKIDRT